MADELFLLVANPVQSVVVGALLKRVRGAGGLTNLSCSDLLSR